MIRKDNSGPWDQEKETIVADLFLENCKTIETVDEALEGAYWVNRYIKDLVEQTQSKRTN